MIDVAIRVDILSIGSIDYAHVDGGKLSKSQGKETLGQEQQK